MRITLKTKAEILIAKLGVVCDGIMTALSALRAFIIPTTEILKQVSGCVWNGLKRFLLIADLDVLLLAV